MSRTITLSTLRTRCQDRGEIRSPYVSTSQLNDWINESIMELYTKICGWNKDYYISSTSVNVVANTSTYALPSDFLYARGLQYTANGIVYDLNRFSWRGRNKFSNTGTTPEISEYRVVGSNLHIIPTPNFTATFTLWYTPVLQTLSSDSDTFDGIAGFEEYVVLSVVSKFRVRADLPREDIIRDLKMQEAHIMSLVQDRDTEPDRVFNIYDNLGGIYPPIIRRL